MQTAYAFPQGQPAQLRAPQSFPRAMLRILLLLCLQLTCVLLTVLACFLPPPGRVHLL